MNRRSQSTRRSLATRISLGVASRLSVAAQFEPPRHGTVAGVVLNTLCNVMGAGVLSLPLATYNASVVVSIVLVLFVAFLACYAVYCLTAASDALQRYSLTELAAFSFFPSREFDIFCAAKLESGDLATLLPDSSAIAQGGRAAGEPASAHASFTAHSTSSSVRGYEPSDPAGATMGSPFARTARRRPFTALELGALRRMHDVDELKRRRRRRLVTMLVEGVIFLCNFGSLVIYCKVVIESIPAVLRTVLSQTESTDWTALMVSSRFWAVLSGIVFFLLSCTRDMEELKWTSLLGFLTIFYIVCAVCYRFGTAHATPPNPDVPAAERGPIRWLALRPSVFRSMATYGLAFGYHVNVPYFYKELRQRELPAMMRSVAVSFPVIILCYIATGLFGYLTFGNLVAAPHVGGNIVSNYAANDVLFLIGHIGLCLHFACVFPIVSICTRRGLHRIVMTLLTWSAQNDTMMLAAGLILDDEPAAQHGDASGGGHNNTSYLPSAATPLLADGALNGLVPAEDLDRDAGSPDDTTRLAIVVEALVLVTSAMVLALVVPGISFVMDIIGTLFSLTLMLVLPSAIGLCIFSTSFATQQQHALVATAALQGPIGWPSSNSAMSRARSAGVLFDSASLAEADEIESRESGQQSGTRTDNTSQMLSAHRYGRIKRLLCGLSLAVGVGFTVAGGALLVWDHWPKA